MSARDRRRAPLELDFSGPRIRLAGLSSVVEAKIRDEWRPFLAAGAGEPLLRLEVEFRPGSASADLWDPKAMRATLEPDGASFSMPEGSASVDRAGRARVTLLRDLGSREFYTLANLLRACLAWSMPERGGAMLHAAGLVVNGRAFILVGPEGSGKSTWTALGEGGGARVLSDDVVLIEEAGGGFEALGSALRSTYDGQLGPGRWPLAGVLFPRHGSPPAFSAVGELISRARLIANLPFVAAGVEADERLAGVLDRLIREVPRAELRFGLDPSFLELLGDWTG